MSIVIGEEVFVGVEIPPTVTLVISPPVVPMFTIIYEEPTTVVIESANTPNLYIPALPGPRGPKGDKGQAGVDGTGISAYTHIQAIPTSVWVINHTLEFNPSVTVIDSAGTVVYGDVSYSGQTITVVFSAGFSGTAYLS